jgi:hypothetical protein
MLLRPYVYAVLAIYNIFELLRNEYFGGTQRTMFVIKDKIPLVRGTGGDAFVPKTSNKINAVSIQGMDYYLNTDLNDEFMNDIHNLPSEKIIKRYALVEADVVDAEGEAQTPQDKQNS